MRRAASRVAGDVATWPIALKPLSAAGMPGPEAVLPPRRLTDGEVGSGTDGRRLTFGAWQLRADQRPMHGTLSPLLRFPVFFQLRVRAFLADMVVAFLTLIEQ